MSRNPCKNKFTADFETTTDVNDTRVWAYAICSIEEPNDFIYGNNITAFMEWCENQRFNPTLYFHNLKFDGEFILNWLLNNGYEFKEDKKECEDKTFTTLITDMGQFYAIEVYFEKGKKTKKVTFYDSLKILNMKVEKIAKEFDLPISKLKIDYQAKREEDHILTKEEIDYIRNDVEIMSRALKIMFGYGLTKITIASDALSSYKEMNKDFSYYFPILDEIQDKDIRKSYKGGFTYLSPLYTEKTTGAGIVYDKNSMYPAKMKNEILPVGKPLFYQGAYEYDENYPLYVQALTCCFKLKKGKIPSIQIKHNSDFLPNKYLESSDNQIVSLTLTSPDLELFLENYDVEDLNYSCGYKFQGVRGLFNEYIDYWTSQKIQAKKNHNQAMYQISKLMLNSLYGKFGTNSKSQLKRPYLGKDGIVHYSLLKETTKDTIYVPVSSFITAYARCDIIRSSQTIREWSLKNKGFDAYVYSDTDSIHCLLNEEDNEQLKKIMNIDDYELGAWKLESKFDRGRYLRQKCYIEEYNGDLVATVAGLPKRMGSLLNFDNFNVGFSTADLPKEIVEATGGKLAFTHTRGGIVLTQTDFSIK